MREPTLPVGQERGQARLFQPFSVLAYRRQATTTTESERRQLGKLGIKRMKNTITVMMQAETHAALEKVPAGTVCAQASRLGVYEGEPLLVIADALLSYAKAYRGRFDGPIAEDNVGAEAFADMLRGVKTFLDFDGGVAMRRGITTDSKDNSAMFEIIDAACKAAGIDYQNL